MNVYYAKCVLYTYPHIPVIMEQIDELVEKRALSSMSDFSPCIEIAHHILDYTKQKDVFIKLSVMTDIILEKFTKEELDCFEYKYFRRKPREYFIGMDTSGRGYFRQQIRLAKRFAKYLEKRGATDAWFEKECMSMDYFREMYRRVIEHEKNSMKNKPNRKKIKENSSINKAEKSSALIA